MELRLYGVATLSTTTFTTSTTVSTMSDEGYPASAWEHTDNESSTYQNLRVPHSQSHPYRSDDSLPAGFHSDTQHNRSNNSPRSSVESPTRLANQRWTAQPAETAHGVDGNIVEAGFDENVLHALLELDVRSTSFFNLQFNT